MGGIKFKRPLLECVKGNGLRRAVADAEFEGGDGDIVGEVGCGDLHGVMIDAVELGELKISGEYWKVHWVSGCSAASCLIAAFVTISLTSRSGASSRYDGRVSPGL